MGSVKMNCKKGLEKKNLSQSDPIFKLMTWKVKKISINKMLGDEIKKIIINKKSLKTKKKKQLKEYESHMT